MDGCVFVSASAEEDGQIDGTQKELAVAPEMKTNCMQTVYLALC